MTRPIRRNFAHLSASERAAYVEAVRQADLHAFSDGVSYWDKQDQIHQSTHNHGGNSFLPWHREFINRYEALLQQSNPDVALHYWDWTQDPRAASDGQGGVVDLSAPTLMGTMNGTLDGTLAVLHNGGVLAGSRDDTGDPADPPQSVTRSAQSGDPSLSSDATIIAAGDALPQAQQWNAFRGALEGAHNTTHGYIGGDIGGQHQAFEDPFVFLLHSNVDRLFAMWQAQAGHEWRLDPDQVYGDQSSTSDSEGILHNLQPWDGTVEFGAPIEPWVGASPLIETKNCRHPSVVLPPCYDTLPLRVQQVSPAPGAAIGFVDVVELLPTARALRLRVYGCRTITAAVSVTAPFTVLAPSVTSTELEGFQATDVLVWVLFAPGAAGTTASGTLTVTVAETGDVFTAPVNANAIPNPDVGTSLVLDTSGSMDAPSGVTTKTRMEVLRESAPLFVALLDDQDGVGVVRFDTDAAPVGGVLDAGPMIGGAGRTAAGTAIATTVTNLAGLTAIGDGLEAAAVQLSSVAASYASTAVIVFTDGHETADKTIAAVASSINSRVFAIGLGTPDQLNPGALADIADGTGGYLMLTGLPGPDDQVRLQKYFAQVLAGATNAAIVVDPDGYVVPGVKVEVPFDITAADIRFDVVVLAEAADAIRVELIAPGGTTVGATNTGVQLTVQPSFSVLRVTPSVAVPTTGPGRWTAVLSIDRRRLASWLARLRKKLVGGDDANGKAAYEQIEASIKVHGVRFTLSVQARSALRLNVVVSQASRRPGSVARLEATLTDGGVPLQTSAGVDVEVTGPDGGVRWLRLSANADGDAYATSIPTPGNGVYRLRVVSRGNDLRGRPFTREALRTASVWARGDDPPATTIGGGPGSGIDVCKLLQCLIAQGSVQSLLKRQGVEAKELLECVKKVCR